MHRLLDLLLALLALALVTPLAALVLLPFAAFAGSTTLLAAVLIALRFGYVYTNVGLQFVASYLSAGRRYPRLGPVDVQTDSDTNTDAAENRMTPPLSPSNSDSGTVTPPPRGPLPNYMTGINYVRPRRRQSTSAAHSPRRELSPSASSSPAASPSPQPQPDQPPRTPTCSCITPLRGQLSPALSSRTPTPPSSPSPSPSPSINNDNNDNDNSSSSNTPQPSYDSYTDLYRRHCERCFEKRTLWFSLQRSRARVSSESLRAIIEAEEGAPAPPLALPAKAMPAMVVPPGGGQSLVGGEGEEEVVVVLPRVTIPRAIPERAGVVAVGVGVGVGGRVGGDDAGVEKLGGSESGSGTSELGLATSGSSSPLLSTSVSTSLVPTPPGFEAGKGKGNGKDKSH